MEKANKCIAVSNADFQAYGCPYCGYKQGDSGKDQKFVSSTYACDECGRENVILGEDVVKSSFGIGSPPVYPLLETHPRKGIPFHNQINTGTSLV